MSRASTGLWIGVYLQWIDIPLICWIAFHIFDATANGRQSFWQTHLRSVWGSNLAVHIQIPPLADFFQSKFCYFVQYCISWDFADSERKLQEFLLHCYHRIPRFGQRSKVDFTRLLAQSLSQREFPVLCWVPFLNTPKETKTIVEETFKDSCQNSIVLDKDWKKKRLIYICILKLELFPFTESLCSGLFFSS